MIQMNTDNYVKLDNLSETQNHLLNVLWTENKEMTLDELTKQLNRAYAAKWSKSQIRQFMESLVIKDYVKKQWHKLKIYYAALSIESNL